MRGSKLLLTVIALSLAAACAPAGTEVSTAPSLRTGPELADLLAVRQDGRHMDLSQDGGIYSGELRPAGFEIWLRQYRKGTPVRICALENASILEAAAEGMEAAGTGCMSPGTGMAVRPGNTTLFLKADAHNFYKDERLSMKGGNAIIRIDSFWSERREWKAGKQKGPVFLIVFSDFDSNGRIGRGELMRLKLLFR